MNQYEFSDNDMFDAVIDEYHKTKRAQTDNATKPSRNIGGITSTSASSHSLTFGATFVKEDLENSLTADQSADASFISSIFLQNLK